MSKPTAVTALEQLSASVFGLCQKIRLSTAAPERLDRARQLVEEANQLLADQQWQGVVSQSHPPQALVDKEFFDEPMRQRRSPDQIMPYSPFIGASNPISPRFEFRIVDPGKRVEGSGVFGAVHAGPPDTLHGGILSGLFDELLGTVCWSGGRGGFTGTLSIRYMHPTPLGKLLIARGEMIRCEGRKAIVKGWIQHDGQVTATAEGIFIRPRQGKMKLGDS